MDNNTFNYNYSSSRNKEVESIRRKYMPREQSKLDILKKLDFEVQTAGIVEAITLGTVGALIFGIGMCFFLRVFTGAWWVAATLMMLGAVLMIPAYPMHKGIARKKREELAPEILRISEEIIES